MRQDGNDCFNTGEKGSTSAALGDQSAAVVFEASTLKFSRVSA